MAVICECDQGAFAERHRPYCTSPPVDLADEWTRWVWKAYGAMLPPPVARLLAATGERP